MVTKQGYIRISQGISIGGGILFIIGGIILIVDFFVPSFSLPDVAVGLIIGTPFYIIQLEILILTVICIAFGALAIILVSREKRIMLGGILVILVGILGLGIPGVVIIIGGSIYIVASTRTR
ncbi:MAG: hypothetical protein KAS52_08400 [Candidatus Heimdallarchaeota archaeon]|nr:hypothetical protein [Candidatus Heimdallarchaeota archaeon]